MGSLEETLIDAMLCATTSALSELKLPCWEPPLGQDLAQGSRGPPARKQELPQWRMGQLQQSAWQTCIEEVDALCRLICSKVDLP